MQYFRRLLRKLTWSKLVSLGYKPTYILAALPVFALISDILRLGELELPCRNKLAIAGLLLLLVGTIMVRIFCPKTIRLAYSLKRLTEDHGLEELKLATQEDLVHLRSHLEISDVARTLAQLLPGNGLKDQDFDVLCTAMGKIQYDKLEEFRLAARELFERVPRLLQYAISSILLIGAILSLAAIILQLFAIYGP